MSLLTIVQKVCQRVGLDIPNAAISSTDPLVQQIVGLVEEEGQELSGGSYDWQLLQQEATFTTVATESQGYVATIAPGYKYIINDTIWDRQTRLPIYGPLSPQQWEQLKALVNTGPWSQYVVRGGQILFTPVPAAGNPCYFLYQSENFIYLAGNTSNTSDVFVNDTDTVAFSERLMILGGIWRWKSAKGFDFSTDLAKYENALSEERSRDAPKNSLSLDGTLQSYFPVVVLPAGNF